MNKKLASLALIVGCFVSSFDAKGMNEQPKGDDQAGRIVISFGEEKDADAEVSVDNQIVQVLTPVRLGNFGILYIDKNQSVEDMCENIYTRALKHAKEDPQIVEWLSDGWSIGKAMDCSDRLLYFAIGHDLEESMDEIRSKGFTIQFGDNGDSLNVGRSIDIEANVQKQFYNEIRDEVAKKLEQNRDAATEILARDYARIKAKGIANKQASEH